MGFCHPTAGIQLYGRRPFSQPSLSNQPPPRRILASHINLQVQARLRLTSLRTTCCRLGLTLTTPPHYHTTTLPLHQVQSKPFLAQPKLAFSIMDSSQSIGLVDLETLIKMYEQLLQSHVSHRKTLPGILSDAYANESTARRRQ